MVGRLTDGLPDAVSDGLDLCLARTDDDLH